MDNFSFRAEEEEVTNPLRKSQTEAVCIKGAAVGGEPQNGPQYGEVLTDGSVYTLNRTEQHAVQFKSQVRRLTPRECERLQGFPDDYTLLPNLKKAADGPRYKALGNSMAVPVMHWIGKRIEMVEEILDSADLF
jgi:DNA (cytosine-5)-methyltransferase 1